MPGAQGGGIFVSYRRQDSSHLAGRLYDRLADRFGEGQVFMDVDTIEPGSDFAEDINRAVAACGVLVAVIGPNWLTATDEQGRRRLDAQDDFVRLEIEAALARGVRVIPILAEGAVMPGPQDLPRSIASLAGRNALLIRHDSFRSDAGRLVTAIERVLATASRPLTASVSPPAQDASPSQYGVAEAAQQEPEAAQKARARATRLLFEAVQVAESITHEPYKVQALADVAKVMAATDPDQAAQLMTDAERIARSITKNPQDSPLADVAMAAAATDPDRAERIVHSITDNWVMVTALADVAKTMAGTDPARAVRLMTDAEYAAEVMTHDQTKDNALAWIARAAAAIDPDRAERIADLLINEYSRATILADVARATAAADPDRAIRLLADAERIAQSLDPSSKDHALVSFARAAAAIDLDRAERIAQSITDMRYTSPLKSLAPGS